MAGQPVARLGDACQAASDLPAVRQAWQQAQQIRNNLGSSDDPRIRARLKQEPGGN